MDPNKISIKDLEEKYKDERNGKIKERLHMILLLKDGYSCRKVAGICHTSKSTVSFWHVRFQEMGYDGLKDKEGREKKSKLNAEQIVDIDKKVSDPYKMANGYTLGWQTKDVYQLIKNEFGIKYSMRHVRRTLRSLGFVMLVPRPRNKKRNQDEVDEFRCSPSKIGVITHNTHGIKMGLYNLSNYS